MTDQHNSIDNSPENQINPPSTSPSANSLVAVSSNPTPRKTISLVLGSGGARGLAHIGIIRWLEAHHYHITFICGSSIGALIGGAHAAGKLDEFEDWICGLSNTDILALTDLAWNRSGLIKGHKLNKALKKLMGDPNIEDLAIPFTAVATDIHNEKEVWLQSGSLLEAMRASYSLPMIFTPHSYKGLTLVDGGVLNPVPMAPTFSHNADLTLAVNLGAKPKHPDVLLDDPSHNSPNENELTHSKKESLWRRFVNKLSPLVDNPNAPTTQPPNWDVSDISNKAFDSMQSSIARQQLAAYPPDITINIARNACGMLEFNKVKKMIELGYQCAEETLGDQKK